MKRNQVQDVVPPRKSIRNVRLSPKKEIEKKERTTYREPEEETENVEDFSRSVPLQVPMRIQPVKKPEPVASEPYAYKYDYSEPAKTKSKKWLYLSVVLLVLATSFGISALFKSANIKISPKTETIALNESFTAKKDVATGLGFQTVSVSKDVEKTVKATGEEKVDKKSQGKIIIYNNYNNQPQKLVATTRFQTPEGLIYRLVSPVTVPGKTTKDGKSVAGSVEVTVEADKPGVSYNIGLKDFTIPGFKGDPKYTSVYGRSKTEMTGGFSGMQKTVSKEVMAQAEEEMKLSVQTALQNDIVAQIPANFVSFKEGLTYRLDPITQVEGATKEDVILRKKGEATAVIFDKGVLTKEILARVKPDVESELVKISNIQDLTFKTVSNASEQDNFTIEANANLVREFDENKLKTNHLNLSKKSALLIIAKYPSINEAWVETKPFWNQKIPASPEKVTLTNTAEN